MDFLSTHWLWFLFSFVGCFGIAILLQIWNIRAIAKGTKDIEDVVTSFGLGTFMWLAGVTNLIFFLVGIISAFITQANRP
jgi:hypothetical protein